jgi:hypothetical protein
MKIRPEHLDALQQEQQARKATGKGGSSFQEILSSELGNAEKAAAPCHSRPPGTVAGPHGLGPLTMSTLDVTPTRQKVMDALDNVLARWDEYGKALRSPQGDLKHAYRVLETISADVRTIRDADPAGSATQQFGPILDELEIMTMTERIKFNRGDYL